MMHCYFWVVKGSKGDSSGLLCRDNASLAFNALVARMAEYHGEGNFTVIKFERVE